MERRYLIVKTSALGDIVQTLPVAAYLKSIDPDCKIDWIAEKGGAALLEACPLIDSVITVDTKKWRKSPFSEETRSEFLHVRHQIQRHQYTMVFDLQGNMKSGIFTFLANAPVKGGFGRKSVPELLNLLFTNKTAELPSDKILSCTEDYLWIVSRLLEKPLPENSLPAITFKVEHFEKELVDSIRASYQRAYLIAPGSAWENKRLSKDQLMQLLKQQPSDIQLFLCWGSLEEHELCQYFAAFFPNVKVLPKLSLAALQLLMSKVDLVISMDSLPLHLAATAGVPTFSYFGPSSALKYAPGGIQHQYVQGSCPYGITFVKRCPKLRTCPSGACIKNLKT